MCGRRCRKHPFQFESRSLEQRGVLARAVVDRVFPIPYSAPALRPRNAKVPVATSGGMTDCVAGTNGSGGPLAATPVAEARQVTAAASKRTTPRATSASPGQFDFIPKPLPGLRGSKVSLACGERSRPPLSSPRRSGWTAKNSTPMITSSAPIHMRTTVTSSRASSSSWHCFRAQQEPVSSARRQSFYPSGPYCFRNAVILAISSSDFRPWKFIFVPV